MHGFIFIDKPKGQTSFACVRDLRRILGVRRIGFLGTLDPLATGLLIFAVGEATKLIPFLEGLDKEYEVVVRFGATSDTYDAEGEIEEVKGASKSGNLSKPEWAQIEQVLKEDFLGEREQVPPAFSAIHIGGKRAYELARAGEKVNLRSRKVIFHDLKLVSYEWPVCKMLVHCSNGTYVRSFVHDLGRKLGCGGYVEALRRTKVGKFSVEDAVRLDENAGRFLVSPEEMFGEWVRMDLSDKEYKILANGGFVPADSVGLVRDAQSAKQPILAFYKGKCVGVLEYKNSKLKFKRKLNIL